MSKLYKNLFLIGAIAASFGAGAQTTNVDIGTGTGTTDNSPIQRYYDYSASELLFTASEINTTGFLTGIGFYKGSGATNITIDSVYIYAKLTTANALTVNTTGTTGYTPVYSGSFPNAVASGWVAVTFNLNSLAYTSGSNLSVLIVRPYQALTASRAFYRYTENAGNRNGWYRNNSAAWSGTMNEVSDWRPNTRLVFSVNPLPIRLGNFSIANKGAAHLIQWDTHEEAKGDVFELERSSDGTRFSTITRVQAKGAAASQYSFTDASPIPGLGYYRLKMIDNDGNVKYSKIIHASLLSNKGLNLTAFPNPATNVLNLATEGAGQLQLSNISGQVIHTYQVSTTGKLTIRTENLAPGAYVLKFSNGKGDKSILFTKE